MTLLLALSLVLATWIGPTLAVGAAGALWALRASTVALAHGWLAAGMRAVWTTSPSTAAASAALLLAAIALCRRRDRPARRYRPAVP